MPTSNLNLSDMDQNQIISHLDELLDTDNSIDNVVSSLDDVHVIANYNLLTQRGATNIDLVKIRDSVNPIVVMNNLEVFQNANVPVDIVKIIYGSFDDEGKTFLMDPEDVDEWAALGADPQVLADKYTQSGGTEPDVVQALLDRGAHVDADKVVNNLLRDDYLLEDFHPEEDIPKLQRAGASPDVIQKLVKHVSDLTAKDEIADYGGSYPDKLDLNEHGRQITKIFFEPRIQIVTETGGQELLATWYGRILPDQTIDEGIAVALKEVYGYAGKFSWRDPYFVHWAKDNKGNNIQRYGIYITLFPADGDMLTA